MVVNRFLTITSAIFIFMFLFIPQEIFAQNKQRIYDEANILNDQEIERLEQLAMKYSDKQATDFVILTTDGKDGTDIENYMADFYDHEGLGYDQKHGNAALLGINLQESDVMVMGFYKAKERLDNDRSTKVREKVTPYLSDQEYFEAFETFIITAADYMRYRPGVNPDNIFYKTSGQLISAIVLGALITFIMVRNVNPKDTTTPATYRNDQHTRVLRKRDRYIRKSVTRKRRPRNNNRSEERGGGGSSFGRTSGGHSYSGSRGKF